MSDAAAAVWELPPIDGPVLARRRRSADLDAVEREAWDKGYAEGHVGGGGGERQEQQAAQAEIERRVQHLGSILEFMAKPIAEVDDQVQRQLPMLAGAIERQLVRRAIK